MKVMPLYIRRLPGARSRLIDPSSVAKDVVCFNPSKAGNYVYIRATQHDAINETNHILLYNETTKFLGKVDYVGLVPTVNLFRGLEDLRLCMWNERLWFTATTTHASHHMTNEMVLGRFSADAARVEFMQVIDVGMRPVKNVCPFVGMNNDLLLLDMFKSSIYKCFLAPSIPPATETWGIELVKTLKWHAGEPDFYRGSTSPVHLHGSTWGCIAHDIIFNDNTQLVTRLSYLHHWVEFDIERGAVTFVSTPFWIAHWGVEYVSGIDKSSTTSDKVTLYIGVMDKDAMAIETTLSDLRCGK